MAEYYILLGGRLDPQRAAWFEGVELTSSGDDTLLRGPLPDQTALHGLLARMRDLNLPLIAVARADALVSLAARLDNR